MAFLYPLQRQAQTAERQAITSAYRMNETTCVVQLLESLDWSQVNQSNIAERATAFVTQMRALETQKGGVESLMSKYDLSSDEGIALMCLAESLLRIPDKHTIDELIKDKLASADWQSHIKKEDSLFVNAATWGLMLTGKIYSHEDQDKRWSQALNKLIKNSSDGVIRTALKQAMRLMGKQFVMGETIEQALKRATDFEKMGYAFSYDMLGEAARTEADAERYFVSYQKAISAIAKAGRIGLEKGASISIKLSALHSRYEHAQEERVKNELYPKLFALAKQAQDTNIGLTVDAEEADRLDLSLDLLEQLCFEPELKHWQGLGLAVQAYQKRAMPVLAYLKSLGEKSGKRLMVRLVKGAYWDAEIKRSQELGLPGYPVFTRKQATDVSYLCCAKFMLANPEVFYPQFATHNAFTLAAIIELAKPGQTYECQRLHGMGDSLYDELVEKKQINVRIYAPVGGHEHLLAYLVRRLLENGANTSFINRIHDSQLDIKTLIACPVAKLSSKRQKPHPQIVLPAAIYGETRLNAKGIDLSDEANNLQLQQLMSTAAQSSYQAYPLSASLSAQLETGQAVTSPVDSVQVGQCRYASAQDVVTAVNDCTAAYEQWDAAGFTHRAAILNNIADLLEANTVKLLYLLTREAGKTLPDAIAELREAVDFCRYYRQQALFNWSGVTDLPGPTGELNQLYAHGRGCMVCISPWNFPLAIFTGQIVAALVSGNTVLAKPAEQTPLVAHAVVELIYEAGVPRDVLACLPGQGDVGAKLVESLGVAGVMFTGSTETAKRIQKTLADKAGPIAQFIAETGGLNCMIVDSSALLEQVVPDILGSAFGAAGQRCSALRVLFVQESIADNLITMLTGAMTELVVGKPELLATDLGPVIDEQAQRMLETHITKMRSAAKLLFQTRLSSDCDNGHFVAPTLIELQSISELSREVFGPILHLVRYPAGGEADVIKQINSTGYGLTFGLHSRLGSSIAHYEQALKVGNCYVNRNMVGAVVGVQPFGGQGLSGTGPKAGGPHYLPSLVTERVLSVNTTAFGGNASLLSIDDDA